MKPYKYQLMKTIFCCLLVVLCVGCASENQQNAMDKIAARYGATVTYTKSLNKTANASGQSAFNIIVKNSKMLDTLSTGQTSTNIASMFFGGLPKEEQAACEVITVEIINSASGKSEKFKYDGHIVQTCYDQAKIFHGFSQALLAKDFDDIAEAMLPEYYTPTLADGIANYMVNLTDAHGTLQNYKLTGIGVITAKDNTRHYQYSGFMTFKDGYHRPYFVNGSVHSEDDEITGFLLEEGIRL